MQVLVMMALGAYRFAMDTGGFQSTERETEWRWAEQEIIGAMPALQYTGPGCDRLTIQGLIYPHYRGGLGQVDGMRAQASLGRPLNLIDGTGRFYGLHVIERIGEGRTTYLPDGAPRRIDFNISLKRFG